MQICSDGSIDAGVNVTIEQNNTWPTWMKSTHVHETKINDTSQLFLNSRQETRTPFYKKLLAITSLMTRKEKTIREIVKAIVLEQDLRFYKKDW